ADRVSIRVDTTQTQGPFKPIYSYFGYDEPNYTYMKDGKKLLSELAALSPAPVYVRAHNLLTTGDGMPALKWGSTNAYTEDASGKPRYDWTIVDRIFDTYVERKMKPLVEIGFMPEALSVKPQPYKHEWGPDKPYAQIYTGWAHPPRDYQKWAELVYQWVRHCVERYGKAEVESWHWEPWNEPNIGYWQGTPQEYHKLYDFTVDAVKRALPSARVGGPHSTGPGSEQAAKFLRDFLEHAVRGKNYVSGKTGSPIDYVGFHAKGSPRVVDGRVQMGIQNQLRSISRGFEIVASFPELKRLPIILGESDPEGCAACSVRFHPQNGYRNGTMYSSYTA
ncbi:MAG: GH39 family glycosyl hydrolase, partial [Gammaproteobacteria bacterium]